MRARLIKYVIWVKQRIFLPIFIFKLQLSLTWHRLQRILAEYEGRQLTERGQGNRDLLQHLPRPAQVQEVEFGEVEKAGTQFSLALGQFVPEGVPGDDQLPPGLLGGLGHLGPGLVGHDGRVGRG